ncbi:redoxin domain-containing protein [Pseudomonas sp. 18058]|uniref:redoxin domain-containing protein n=1 Tax=Pseudomonas sp. 18058 TaxID=2681406 RepID=UPI001C49AC4F|nr:redoxin domain-containing protein [Pseudomonas sp. 18058]
MNLMIAAGLIIAPVVYANESETSPTYLPQEHGLISYEAPTRFDGVTRWLNTSAFGTKDLAGKVVVVNFWTYSCINSLRQIPYVRAWAKKYESKGLVVIGVHSPEFEFEQNVENVRRGIEEADVDYPVAIDNDHRVWQAFGNNAWPALYFIDPRGRVRYVKIGEGDYAASERVIEQLLDESGNHQLNGESVSVTAQGVEAAADWSNLRSQETYIGYGRAERFSSVGGTEPNRTYMYALPPYLPLNRWAFSGGWRVGEESAIAKGTGAQVVYRFHARDVHLVMRASSGAPIHIRVTLDGKAPGVAHGLDIDGEGNGKVDSARMYQLIRQPYPITDHQIEIEFLDPGSELYAFTFG